MSDIKVILSDNSEVRRFYKEIRIPVELPNEVFEKLQGSCSETTMIDIDDVVADLEGFIERLKTIKRIQSRFPK